MAALTVTAQKQILEREREMLRMEDINDSQYLKLGALRARIAIMQDLGVFSVQVADDEYVACDEALRVAKHRNR
jgi:hypothetical protein